MTALLLLRTAAAGRYAIPVGDTAGVRRHEPLEPLPDPLPGVVGLLRDAGAPPVPVLAPFGADGAHVVLLVPDGAPRFGLLVTEVEGVVRIDDADLGPAPAGSRSRLVVGVAGGDAGGALLLDAARLARALAPDPESA